MKIEKDKTYTLYELFTNGLILNTYGVPARNIRTARLLLKREGFQPEINEERGQVTFKIKGEDLLKINKKYAKKRKTT